MLDVCNRIELSMEMDESQKIYDIVANVLQTRRVLTEAEVMYIKTNMVKRNEIYDNELHNTAQYSILRYERRMPNIMGNRNMPTGHIMQEFLSYQEKKKRLVSSQIMASLDLFKDFERFYERKILKCAPVDVIENIHKEMLPAFYIYYSLRCSIGTGSNGYIVDINHIVSIKDNL